ncbi:hypothetical protein SeLEV6574_g05167 [Synchytrium endobioticum]|uniref:Uncharacterized protein n=1 Tax=Synchytrium endobioticum TaxID=286115 RepID=A0A507C9T6_9FUNG|nr:hypothetical protein SeLEV6574_g08082 [Synchytrium endobioticum]TPX43233.1 hypothetical protein SeLEV6574_g05167 [Synchytrium endobioticum]
MWFASEKLSGRRVQDLFAINERSLPKRITLQPSAVPRMISDAALMSAVNMLGQETTVNINTSPSTHRGPLFVAQERLSSYLSARGDCGPNVYIIYCTSHQHLS